MNFKEETITPEKAKRYLATSKGNRRLRPMWIQHLAEAIRRNEFYLTHQGIAFNSDDTLRDGHHRLHAIIEAGIAVKMTVSRGLDDAAVIAIDSGAKRSLPDQFNFRGVECDHTTVATANVMRNAPKIGFGSSITPPGVVLAFMTAHLDAIQYGRGCVVGRRRNSILMGACSRAYYHANETMRDHIATMLKDGDAAERMPGDKSLIRLRDLFASIDVNGGSRLRVELYCKAQNAIRAFLDGIELKKIYASYEDLLPLPA